MSPASTAQPAARLALLALLLAGACGLAVIAAGPGYHLGIWELRTGFTILRYGAYTAAGAALLSVVGVVAAVASRRPRGVVFGIAGVIIGLVSVAVPWQWQRTARGVPSIHDITTDTGDPPAFVAVLPLRADAPNPSEYGGPELAAAQQAGYPDLGPTTLEASTSAAFGQALRAAEEMGWEIVAADSAEGRIEATATTRWFGFKDDVVIRIRPTHAGSRIDVRSVSRVGRGDVGTNARRIQEFQKRLP